jgi:anti-sigma-K factor RskA
MGCKEIKEFIFEYPDGDLSQSERLEVEVHLKECRDCSLFFNESHQVWDLLDKWDGIETEGDFVAKFWNRFSENDKSGILDSLRNWKLNWAAAAAVVFILVMSVIGVSDFESNRTNVVFTERDKADEELLVGFDKSLSVEESKSLDIYGPWDETTQENSKGG